MKKTYITVSTLLILFIAGILTYISNVRVEIPQPEISDIVATSSKPASNPIVAENPDGEASPSVMRLNMKTWNWIQTTYPVGTGAAPRQAERFKLTFSEKSFSASTDCNGIGGEYTVKNNSLKFDKMMSTLMYCEGSQESMYREMLAGVVNYEFTNRGELLLKLADDGTMLYK